MQAEERGWIWFVVLALAVTAVAGAGYLGFVLFPGVEGSGGALFALAAAAGIASFFAPCSFPLLLALLGREHAPDESRLAVSAALAAGAVVFLVGVGAIVAVAGAAVFADVTFVSTAGRTIRIVTGSALIVLGVLQADLFGVRPFGPVERAAKALLPGDRLGGGSLGAGAFGFFYLLAGFG